MLIYTCNLNSNDVDATNIIAHQQGIKLNIILKASFKVTYQYSRFCMG
jgi:hypothetical protein